MAGLKAKTKAQAEATHTKDHVNFSRPDYKRRVEKRGEFMTREFCHFWLFLLAILREIQKEFVKLRFGMANFKTTTSCGDQTKMAKYS